MKKLFKKLFTVMSVMLAVLVAFAAVGCGSAGVYGGWFPSGSADKETGTAEPAVPGEDGSSDESSGGSQTTYVKQLTGAEWRDATDYDFWLELFKKDVQVGGQGQQGDEQTTRNGIFYEYAKASRELDTFDMHEISVTYDGSPVVGAQVELYYGDDVVYSAVSDSAGTAYVFGDGTRVEATSGQYVASASVADGVTCIELNGFDACDNELEIMFVVDTTGSMGDELSFLCDELAGVVTRVSSALKCGIRMGLLFYRDDGDAYVTRKFDFVEVTTTAGLNTVVKNINAQKSAGGGDYPEAVDKALSEAVAANWHSKSKTKLLFHVLDAPYHDEQENQGRFAQAVKTAAQKGIRIIPVAASGLDVLGQYTMRSAALLTGGTYTFLTDDSGIGGSHELPAVGKYTVEYLSDLMVRLIEGYYTGTFAEPVPWTQSSNVI